MRERASKRRSRVSALGSRPHWNLPTLLQTRSTVRNYLAKIGFLILACGCVSSAPGVETPLVEKEAQPKPSVDICLERLLQAPVIETDEAVSDSVALSNGIPIPSSESLAPDGRRYELLLDHESGRAWIRTRGGIGGHLSSLNGPWPIADPNVQALRQSITPEC